MRNETLLLSVADVTPLAVIGGAPPAHFAGRPPLLGKASQAALGLRTRRLWNKCRPSYGA